ncbi:MAG TPA: rhodanese-like domain-containing protein [Vicinamibacterales bacterium]
MHENPSRLSVTEVQALLDRGEPVTFIDSRNPIAWASSKLKIRGAHRVPIDEVPQHVHELPRDQRLIVYCT